MSEEIEQELQQEQQQEDVHQPNEFESKASEQGWTTKEQWRGDPDKWVDAKEFVERGEKNNAILRERNDRLINEVTGLKQELRASVREFGEASRKAEQRAYEKAMRDLQQQQRAAVENGDTAAWQRLENERTDLSKEFAETRKPEPQQRQANPDEDPNFKAWHGDNGWYNRDVEMTAFAEHIAPVVARRHNGQVTRAFYDEIAAEVKKKFADKFRNTNRDAPGAVQGASQAGGKVKRGKGYSDLPPEAKAACDKFVKQGLMKQDEYVRDFFGE